MCTDTETTPTDDTAKKPEITYFYFGRNLWAQHRGIVTAGIMPANPAEPEGVQRTAFAFCSPTDNFRRHTAEPLRRNVRKSVQQQLDELRVAAKAVITNPGEPTRNSVRRAIVETKVETVHEQAGGIDIVRARMGLVQTERYKAQFYETPMDGTSLRTVISVFNDMMPAEDKPQLWRDRVLVVAARILLGAANAQSRDEISSAAYLLPAPCDAALGFLPADIL